MAFSLTHYSHMRSRAGLLYAPLLTPFSARLCIFVPYFKSLTGSLNCASGAGISTKFMPELNSSGVVERSWPQTESP